MSRMDLSRSFLKVGAIISGMALGALIAGLNADGWTLAAFDTGPSRHFDQFMMLCPLAVLLAGIALRIGWDDWKEMGDGNGSDREPL